MALFQKRFKSKFTQLVDELFACETNLKKKQCMHFLRSGNFWTKHGIPATVLLSLHHAAVKFDANSLPAPCQRVCPIKIDSFVYLQDLQGGSCILDNI